MNVVLSVLTEKASFTATTRSRGLVKDKRQSEVFRAGSTRASETARTRVKRYPTSERHAWQPPPLGLRLSENLETNERQGEDLEDAARPQPQDRRKR